MSSAECTVILLTCGTNPSLSRFSYLGDTIWFIDERQHIGKTRDCLGPYQESWKESRFLLNGQLRSPRPWLRAKSSSQHLSLSQIGPCKDEARSAQLLGYPSSFVLGGRPLDGKRSNLPETVRNFDYVAVQHSPKEFKAQCVFLAYDFPNHPLELIKDPA